MMTPRTASLVILAALAGACSKGTATRDSPAPGHIAIKVTANGFEPAKLHVAAGTPVSLDFTRTTDQTCAKQVILDLGDNQKIERDLPLNQTVAIAATFPKAGELRYACAMDMVSGVVVVQ